MLCFFFLTVQTIYIICYLLALQKAIWHQQTCHSYWFYQYIQIFYPSNLAKYRFSSLKYGKIQIFFRNARGFSYIFLSHTDFFPKILIFLVIHTDFVLEQSGRSAPVVSPGYMCIFTLPKYKKERTFKEKSVTREIIIVCSWYCQT